MKELRTLFVEAASEQWYPESKIMAEVMTRMESVSEGYNRAALCCDARDALGPR